MHTKPHNNEYTYTYNKHPRCSPHYVHSIYHEFPTGITPIVAICILPLFPIIVRPGWGFFGA